MSCHNPGFWKDDGRRPYTGLDWLEDNPGALRAGFCYAVNGWGVVAQAVTIGDLEESLGKKAFAPELVMLSVPHLR